MWGAARWRTREEAGSPLDAHAGRTESDAVALSVEGNLG